MNLLRSALLLFALTVPFAATAAGETSGGIQVTDAWSRATPASDSTGVVYLTITDEGAPDRLTGCSTPVAEKATLHRTHREGDMMRMTDTESLPVSSAAPAKLSPGGYHLMLTGLKQPLKAGDQFPLTLTFEHAGDVTTTVAVRPIGATSSDKPAMDHMNMDEMPGMGHE